MDSEDYNDEIKEICEGQNISMKICWAWYEELQVYICLKNANHKNEYLMNM